MWFEVQLIKSADGLLPHIGIFARVRRSLNIVNNEHGHGLELGHGHGHGFQLKFIIRNLANSADRAYCVEFKLILHVCGAMDVR